MSAKKVVQLITNRACQLEFDQVNFACNLLNSKGGVIALPTDTLYGIVARVEDSSALQRIYNIKGRDHGKPLAVCVSKIERIADVADISGLNKNIFSNLLPGPITIVLRRKSDLNKDLNPNCDTIGVRVPDHNFIMALSTLVGPLALTSANRSGGKDPITVNDFQEIWDDLDCVLDGGITQDVVLQGVNISKRMERLGSTVVDLSDYDSRTFRIIREGSHSSRASNILHRLGYIKKTS